MTRSNFQLNNKGNKKHFVRSDHANNFFREESKLAEFELAGQKFR